MLVQRLHSIVTTTIEITTTSEKKNISKVVENASQK